MASLDLHLHTTYSDGTLSPAELVAAAAERKVTLIAVTDHDEIGGVALAQAAALTCGIEVITGVEINTEVGREDVHILGYGFPVDSPVMHAGLQERRAARLHRTEQMVERLHTLGYPVEMERVLEIAGSGSVGRPHIARALIETGLIRDVNEAFDHLIGNRGPAYVPRTPFAPEEAIDLIHRAGGIASLAHPGKLGDPIRFIQRLKTVGLDALEAYHTDHQRGTTDRLLRWARQYELGVTGGSDSHGPYGPRPVPVGSVAIPDAVAAQFRAMLRR